MYLCMYVDDIDEVLGWWMMGGLVYSAILIVIYDLEQ